MAPPPVSRVDVISILQLCESARQNYLQAQAIISSLGLVNEATQLDEPLRQIEETVKQIVRDNTLY